VYLHLLTQSAHVLTNLAIWVQAYRAWGSALQAYYQTRNSPYRESDFTSDYLGYWTDGGACYYYWTETGQTYEETILSAKLYADNINIPYRWVTLMCSGDRNRHVGLRDCIRKGHCLI
jgi:hypothetical protein